MRIGVFLLALLLGSQVLALSTDREQPVEIEADWAQADDIKGTAVYKGAVVLKQGTIRVMGDTVTMYYNEHRDLTKMVAVGKPARFHQQPDGAQELQQAKAQRIEFYMDDDLVILLGEARAWQGKDSITGDRIVFDTLNSRIKARVSEPTVDKKTKKSRVKIIIAPKPKCADADKDPSEECRK